MALSGKHLLFSSACWIHITCPNCNVLSVAVAMTARQLGLEEPIQWHILIDGGHSADPLVIFLYVINMFGDMNEQSGVIRDTIARVMNS